MGSKYDYTCGKKYKPQPLALTKEELRSQPKVQLAKFKKSMVRSQKNAVKARHGNQAGN